MPFLNSGHDASAVIWRLWLPQSLRQVLRFEMGVPLEHLQRLVSGDGRYLHHAQPFLEQATCCLVAQIMETRRSWMLAR